MIWMSNNMPICLSPVYFPSNRLLINKRTVQVGHHILVYFLIMLLSWNCLIKCSLDEVEHERPQRSPLNQGPWKLNATTKMRLRSQQGVSFKIISSSCISLFFRVFIGVQWWFTCLFIYKYAGMHCSNGNWTLQVNYRMHFENRYRSCYNSP